MQIARDRGATWALTLDTDERIVFQGIRDMSDLKNRLDAFPQVDAWLVESRDRSYSKERFLRTSSLLQWNGKTHKALVCAAPFQRGLLDGCVFWEETKSETANDKKFRRDLQILRDETARQPLDPRWWYYLGQTWEGQI